MTSGIRTIREAAELTRECVLEGEWRQSQGRYDPDQPCCVGAKLAHCLVDGIYSYEGVEAFAAMLGVTVGRVRCLLWLAGAGPEPFGMMPWPNTREEVWDNLARMERLPTEDDMVLWSEYGIDRLLDYEEALARSQKDR